MVYYFCHGMSLHVYPGESFILDSRLVNYPGESFILDSRLVNFLWCHCFTCVLLFLWCLGRKVLGNCIES